MTRFLNYHQARGHIFGECWSHPNIDLMYVNIPKNATSWTKVALISHQWECYNYHLDNLYHKKPLVVLRDPIDRWVSGIAEFFYLYHRDLSTDSFNSTVCDIIFDKVAFDDHTERQTYFLEGLDPENCVYFMFDNNYQPLFSQFLSGHGISNTFTDIEKKHVSDLEPVRRNFKKFFKDKLTEPNYLNQIKSYFEPDYQLIDSVKFYKGM